KRVDAPLNDGNRLLDHLADTLDTGRLRHSQSNETVAGIGNVQRALAAAGEHAAERLRQVAQLAQRLTEIGIFANTHLDTVVALDEVAVADPCVAQRAADVVKHRIKPLLAHVVGVDLEQDVRAALQIETEHEMALCPCRPGLYGLLRKEIRHGEQEDNTRGCDTPQCLPPREIEHDPVPDSGDRGLSWPRLRPSPARLWRARPTPWPGPAAPGRPRQSRPRSGRH